MPPMSVRSQLAPAVLHLWTMTEPDPMAFATAVVAWQNNEHIRGTDARAILQGFRRSRQISAAAADSAVALLHFSERDWRERTLSPPSTPGGRGGMRLRRSDSNNSGSERSNLSNGSSGRSNLSNNSSGRSLGLNRVPYGARMPRVARENLVTMENVPFDRQVYLLDDVDDDGRPRRVYALSTLLRVRNGRNPVTRATFENADIRRVA